ncbi:hypothetical protein [Geodermatophilus chilensis]|uniref:hypothetical protein n=1 Tax=Geodermatophilus chilensis TaxID=2035835 RepID=UPI000C264AF2|nr:hypothetical protein [Geodermatophilus chilensis]
MSELRCGTDIGDFLVSARSSAEYRAMFALTDADLRGRVLDCPGGGASFTAAARARGGRALRGLLASVLAALGNAGVQALVQDVPYEFQRGARSMLRLRAAPARTGVRRAGAPGAGGRMPA